MDYTLQNAHGQDERTRRNFIEMLKALFGRDSNGKPSINVVKAKKKDIDNMVHNIGVASKQMLKRAEDLNENGQHFKALLLTTRAEQMNEIAEAFNYPSKRKEGVVFNYDQMAEDLERRLEAKMDGIKDTKLFNQAQTDFARFKLDPDERLKLDQDILKSSFSDRNPADAAFVRYINSSTEAFCKQNIKDIKPAASENGLEVGVERTNDYSGINHTKTDPEAARKEREMTGGRPKNTTDQTDHSIGFGDKSLMPEAEPSGP